MIDDRPVVPAQSRVTPDTPPHPGQLDVATEIQDRAATLTPRGELDLANADRLVEAVAEMEERSPARITIDLGELRFIDSTGLRAILQADARARERGYELLLLPGVDTVQRVFELTGTSALLRFVERDAPPGDQR